MSQQPTSRRIWCAMAAVIAVGGVALWALYIKPGAELNALLKSKPSTIVPLTKAWVGQSKVALQTGDWPDDGGRPQEDVRTFVFDTFCHWSENATWSPGQMTLAEGVGSLGVVHQHIFKKKLPTDNEITNAQSADALFALFGPITHPASISGDLESLSSYVSWSCFARDGYSTIRTLSVQCTLKKSLASSDWHIERIKVWRGTAKPI